MELNIDDNQHSDDEIFFGKLSLREFKKHILWNKVQSENHEPYGISKPDHSKSLDIDNPGLEFHEHNASFKIIESHSEPNLNGDTITGISSKAVTPDRDPILTDDSFLAMENMVSNFCVSPGNSQTNEKLNNTLEVIDYILKNAPKYKDNIKKEIKEEVPDENTDINLPKSIESFDKTKLKSIPDQNIKNPDTDFEIYTPTKVKITPMHENNFVTPLLESKLKIPTFKTLTPIKKPSAISMRTPSKTNLYKHISSPVASYINKCPQVPLVKKVNPNRLLLGTSSIPKFVKGPPQIKPSNKENLILPSLAYRSAKNTKVINVPDEEKLPLSAWVEQITSLPKPTVITHGHREVKLGKKQCTIQQEESFGDLPYNQAEVSVCTQKSAFKINNHI